MNALEQAVYAILISFVIGVILCPILIPILHKMKFGQNVRDDGPQTHLQKQGTPTMGGIAFLIAFVVASVFFLRDNADGAAVVLMTLCYGLIGFLDDYIKVVKKRNLGLRARAKIVAQVMITAAFLCALTLNGTLTTYVTLPVLGTVDFSVLFADTVIEEGAVVRDSIIMPGAKIKKGAVVQYAIIGEDTVVEENAVFGERPEEAENLDAWGVAVAGADLVIGAGARVPAKAMVEKDVKGAVK